MSEQLWELATLDDSGCYPPNAILRWVVPVTKEDITNSPELTELFWDLVYGEAAE